MIVYFFGYNKLMVEKFKDFFPRLKKLIAFVFPKNKPYLWFGALLIFIFLGLLFPFHSAQALAGLAVLIAAAIVIAILQVMVSLTSLILWVATIL